MNKMMDESGSPNALLSFPYFSGHINLIAIAARIRNAANPQ